MPRILIADTDPDIQRVVNPFQAEGCELELIRSGTEVIQRLVTGQFDLILIDWDMPQLPGARICRGYRQRGGAAHIIALTKKSNMETKQECLSSGANDVVTKPFYPQELLAKVNIVIKPLLSAQPEPPNA